MRSRTLVLLLLALPLPALAAGGSGCDDLKEKIATGLEAKGVTDYTLDIVDSADVGEAKVVGSCAGGSRKITYSRGGGSTASSTMPPKAGASAAEPSSKPTDAAPPARPKPKKLVPDDAPPGIWPPPS